ncbi:VgrG-related protein [Fundidesulfovibrio putealis]|uniref:VgrG-related protein n=1 Tax=Fundidesulfovibrio putealis TaxID=270496 RepID=UPI0006846105|nr:hypothetical protein [Fundidesulfovibrio putealis]
MNDSHLRFLTALSLTLWMVCAPRPALPHEVESGVGRIVCNESEVVCDADGTASTQAGSDSTTAVEATARQVEAMLWEKQARGSTDQVDSRENKPGWQSDEVGHMNECAGGSRSTSTLSSQEEDLLLRVAAAESSLTSAGRNIPVAVAGLAIERGDAKAEPVGTLSWVYESGGNSAAIGYDAKGGTSYGLYQIASNSGTMNQFLQYLAAKAPDLYSRLVVAGPDNTGSKSGGKPEVWKQIAAEQDKRFAALQHDFIRESHYVPAARSISMTCGMIVSEKPQAIREVLWSTSVHHGVQRATQIFLTAADNLQAKGKNAQNLDRSMIEEVYRLRSDLFGGAGEKAAAIRNRLRTEKEYAVAML